MRGWYQKIENSRVYGLFLRHRAWARNSVSEIGLLGFIPMFSVVVVWFIPPMLICAMTAAPSLGHNQIITGGVWALVTLTAFMLFFPFSVRVSMVVWDTLGFGAWSMLLSPNGEYTQMCRDIAQQELWEWCQKNE